MRRRLEHPTTSLLRAVSRLLGVLIVIGLAHILCRVFDGIERFGR